MMYTLTKHSTGSLGGKFFRMRGGKGRLGSLGSGYTWNAPCNNDKKRYKIAVTTNHNDVEFSCLFTEASVEVGRFDLKKSFSPGLSQ